MQESIIVRDNGMGSQEQLQKRLDQGWKVVSMCGMPSSCAEALTGSSFSHFNKNYPPTCLVIISKA